MCVLHILVFLNRGKEKCSDVTTVCTSRLYNPWLRPQWPVWYIEHTARTPGLDHSAIMVHRAHCYNNPWLRLQWPIWYIEHTAGLDHSAIWYIEHTATIITPGLGCSGQYGT